MTKVKIIISDGKAEVYVDAELIKECDVVSAKELISMLLVYDNIAEVVLEEK